MEAKKQQDKPKKLTFLTNKEVQFLRLLKTLQTDTFPTLKALSDHLEMAYGACYTTMRALNVNGVIYRPGCRFIVNIEKVKAILAILDETTDDIPSKDERVVINRIHNSKKEATIRINPGYELFAFETHVRARDCDESGSKLLVQRATDFGKEQRNYQETPYGIGMVNRWLRVTHCIAQPNPL